MIKSIVICAIMLAIALGIMIVFDFEARHALYLGFIAGLIAAILVRQVGKEQQ